MLQTVKLTFQSETHFVKAIDERPFLECLYFQPTEFVQNGITIIRCYNCQKFGHLSARCHSKTILANTVAENTHSKSAQKQKPTAYVQIAKETGR